MMQSETQGSRTLLDVVGDFRAEWDPDEEKLGLGIEKASTMYHSLLDGFNCLN